MSSCPIVGPEPVLESVLTESQALMRKYVLEMQSSDREVKEKAYEGLANFLYEKKVAKELYMVDREFLLSESAFIPLLIETIALGNTLINVPLQLNGCCMITLIFLESAAPSCCSSTYFRAWMSLVEAPNFLSSLSMLLPKSVEEIRDHLLIEQGTVAFVTLLASNAEARRVFLADELLLREVLTRLFFMFNFYSSQEPPYFLESCHTFLYFLLKSESPALQVIADFDLSGFPIFLMNLEGEQTLIIRRYLVQMLSISLEVAIAAREKMLNYPGFVSKLVKSFHDYPGNKEADNLRVEIIFVLQDLLSFGTALDRQAQWAKEPDLLLLLVSKSLDLNIPLDEEELETRREFIFRLQESVKVFVVESAYHVMGAKALGDADLRVLDDFMPSILLIMSFLNSRKDSEINSPAEMQEWFETLAWIKKDIVPYIAPWLLLEAREGKRKLLDEFLQSGCLASDLIRGADCLRFSLECEHFDLAQSLMLRGVNKREQSPDQGITALMVAASKGRTDILESLLADLSASEKEEHVNVSMSGGQTALLWAVRFNQMNAVEYLLQCGADIQKSVEVAKGRNNALIIAAKCFHKDILRRLIIHGVQYDLLTETDYESLTQLARDTRSRSVLSLLSATRSEAFYSLGPQDLVSILSIQEKGAFEKTIVKLLAKPDASLARNLMRAAVKTIPNFPTGPDYLEEMRELLHKAIESGNRELVRVLLCYGCAPNGGPRDQVFTPKPVKTIKTSLHFAIRNLQVSPDLGRHYEIIHDLITFGADVNQKDNALAEDEYGDTPLCLLLRKNQEMRQDIPLALFQQFLEAGADPLKPSEDGTTPILLAGDYHREDVLEALLRKLSSNPEEIRAALNQVPRLSTGEVLSLPIVMAVESSRVEMVDTLIRFGVDVDQLNPATARSAIWSLFDVSIDFNRNFTSDKLLSLQNREKILVRLLRAGARLEILPELLVDFKNNFFPSLLKAGFPNLLCFLESKVARDQYLQLEIIPRLQEWLNDPAERGKKVKLLKLKDITGETLLNHIILREDRALFERVLPFFGESFFLNVKGAGGKTAQKLLKEKDYLNWVPAGFLSQDFSVPSLPPKPFVILPKVPLSPSPLEAKDQLKQSVYFRMTEFLRELNQIGLDWKANPVEGNLGMVKERLKKIFSEDCQRSFRHLDFGADRVRLSYWLGEIQRIPGTSSDSAASPATKKTARKLAPVSPPDKAAEKRANMATLNQLFSKYGVDKALPQIFDRALRRELLDEPLNLSDSLTERTASPVLGSQAAAPISSPFEVRRRAFIFSPFEGKSSASISSPLEGEGRVGGVSPRPSPSISSPLDEERSSGSSDGTDSVLATGSRFSASSSSVDSRKSSSDREAGFAEENVDTVVVESTRRPSRRVINPGLTLADPGLLRSRGFSESGETLALKWNQWIEDFAHNEESKWKLHSDLVTFYASRYEQALAVGKFISAGHTDLRHKWAHAILFPERSPLGNMPLIESAFLDPSIYNEPYITTYLTQMSVEGVFAEFKARELQNVGKVALTQTFYDRIRWLNAFNLIEHPEINPACGPVFLTAHEREVVALGLLIAEIAELGKNLFGCPSPQSSLDLAMRVRNATWHITEGVTSTGRARREMFTLEQLVVVRDRLLETYGMKTLSDVDSELPPPRPDFSQRPPLPGFHVGHDAYSRPRTVGGGGACGGPPLPPNPPLPGPRPALLFPGAFQPAGYDGAGRPIVPEY
jgi:ankyrin repeat protein